MASSIFFCAALSRGAANANVLHSTRPRSSHAEANFWRTRSIVAKAEPVKQAPPTSILVKRFANGFASFRASLAAPRVCLTQCKASHRAPPGALNSAFRRQIVANRWRRLRWPARAWRFSERVETGECLSEDERVHLVCALVRVDALEVQHVSDDGILEENSIAPEDAAAGSGDGERVANVVPLAERNLGRGDALSVFHAREVQGEE